MWLKKLNVVLGIVKDIVVNQHFLLFPQYSKKGKTRPSFQGHLKSGLFGKELKKIVCYWGISFKDWFGKSLIMSL